MAENLVFYHIPKTAGTTFNVILNDVYGKQAVFHLSSFNTDQKIRAFRELPEKERAAFNVLRGHLVNYIVEDYPVPFRSVVFLRHPVDRFLSGYYYIKRAHWNAHHEHVKGMSSPAEFLDYAGENGLLNVQTRYLAGKLDHILNSKKPTPLTPNDFELAKKQLNKMDFVLLTEEFDESLFLLQKKLNWNNFHGYAVANKTDKKLTKKDLSDNEVEEIRDANRYDTQIYQYGKLRFFEQMSEFDSNQIRSEIKNYRRESKVSFFRIIYNSIKNI